MIKTKKPICPSGYNLKNAYKTKRGNIIQSQCIQNTNIISPVKRNSKKIKTTKKSKKSSLKPIKYKKKISIPIRKYCKEGETLRSGYRRKSYDRIQGKHKGLHYRHTVVSPGCIKKRSNKYSTKRIKTHKSKKSNIIILDKDDHLLSEYGYFNVAKKNKSERILSLSKLINYFLPIKGEMATYNYIIKALNARYILNKNSNPKTAKIFKNDQKTISKLYRHIKNKK